MNFLKKDHKLVGENEQVTKTTKHDVNLRKNSTIYFQVGLILTLLAVHGLFEMQFQVKPFDFGDPPDLVEPDAYVNYVPEPIPEPVVEEPQPEPQRRSLLAINFKPIENDAKVEESKKEIVIEPPAPTIPSKPTLSKPKMPDVKKPHNINTVEQVPIYPGCEKYTTNDDRRACMSKKIGRLIGRKFNTGIGNELGLQGKQRISVQFKIDAQGYVTEIMARAPHNKLEREAVKVVGKIPQMIPGKQRDKNVSVIYSLPIIFQVQQ
jgi:protein TonB